MSTITNPIKEVPDATMIRGGRVYYEHEITPTDGTLPLLEETIAYIAYVGNARYIIPMDLGWFMTQHVSGLLENVLTDLFTMCRHPELKQLSSIQTLDEEWVRAAQFTEYTTLQVGTEGDVFAKICFAAPARVINAPTRLLGFASIDWLSRYIASQITVADSRYVQRNALADAAKATVALSD